MSATSKGNRYGRQGGGWAEDAAGHLADELAAARQRGVNARLAGDEGAWPAHAMPGAAPLEMTARPADTEAWEGRARMAVCRRDAGLDLGDLDREALRRCPEPGGWVGAAS